MPIAFRNAGTVETNGSTATSLGIAYNAGGSPVNGDLLILVLNTRAGSATVSNFNTPAGWNVISKNYMTNVCQAVYWKIANNESGTYTITWTGADFAGLTILRYSGANQSSPIDAYSVKDQTAGSGGVFATNSVSSSQNNDCVLSIHDQKLAAVADPPDWTPPTNSTERIIADVTNVSGNCVKSVEFCDEIISGSWNGSKSATSSISGANTGSATIILIKAPALSILKQEHGRIYKNDAGLNSATPYASEDVSFYNIQSLQNIRIRYTIANVGSAAGNITPRLEFKEDGGAWTQITTGSNNVRLSASAQFSDGDATTQRLSGTGTFTEGQGKYSGSDASQKSLNNGYNSEWEWCIKFENSAQGHTYQFRITNAGTVLDDYLITLSIIPVAYNSDLDMFTYDASAFDPQPAIYFEATFRTGSSNYPAHARLFNITDDIPVSGSDIENSTTILDLIRTAGAVALTTAKKYCVQWGIAKGGTLYKGGSRLALKQ